jgi:hypothetical protein
MSWQNRRAASPQPRADPADMWFGTSTGRRSPTSTYERGRGEDERTLHRRLFRALPAACRNGPDRNGGQSGLPQEFPPPLEG